MRLVGPCHLQATGSLIRGFQKITYPASDSQEAPAVGAKGCKPELATLLDKDRHYLRNKHLIPMSRDRLLRFRYPESAKHPHQTHVAAGAEDKNNG